MVPWNAARTKVQIKLSIQRLRTLQEKKLALAKASRRDIADLLQKGRVETARLRVEGLIQDDIYVELLEVLELYLETLQARFGLLDMSSGETPEASIADAVHAVVYAAPRVELKEMHMLREMLMHKYGRTFSLSLQPSNPPPSIVPKRVLSKLALFIPSKELVDAYLGEIARGYGVAWAPEPTLDELKSGENAEVGGGDDASGGVGKHEQDGEKTKVGAGDGDEEEEESGGVKGGTSVPPPPAGPEKDAWAAPAPATKKLTEEEELAKRFERLKQLK